MLPCVVSYREGVIFGAKRNGRPPEREFINLPGRTLTSPVRSSAKELIEKVKTPTKLGADINCLGRKCPCPYIYLLAVLAEPQCVGIFCQMCFLSNFPPSPVSQILSQSYIQRIMCIRSTLNVASSLMFNSVGEYFALE